MRLRFLVAMGLFGVVMPVCSQEKLPDLRTRKTGDDWPQFLGANSDSISREKGIITEWTKKGLEILWEAPMGLGYAPPVTSLGRLFHFDRFGDSNRLSCRNAETGKLLWKYEYETRYEDRYGYSPGPRACPVVDDERAYAYGPEGRLIAVNIADGKLLWQVDTQATYKFHQNFFGVGSVPLVYENLLIVAVGGSPPGEAPDDFREVKGNGSCIVAFDKKTGKEVYKLSNDLASYSSPIIRRLGDKPICLYLARGGLLGFEPKSGKIDFEYKYRAKSLESVNASNPVVIGDQILLTECYGPGGILLKYNAGKLEKIWDDASKDDRRDHSMRCHWNTPVVIDGYAYGSSGRHENEAELRCIELKTGNLMWREKGLSRTSLTAIDGHFLNFSETGLLQLFKINPKKFELVAKWDLDLDAPCWSAPVISHGLMYIRGKDRLLCVRLIPEAK